MAWEISLSLLKASARRLIQFLVYVLTAVVVSEMTIAVLVPVVQVMGSTAFIIIALCAFAFGCWFFFLGSVKVFDWNTESKFIKLIWNNYGATLLITIVIAVITFLITLVSLTITIIEFCYPQLLLLLGAGLLIFIYVVGHFADKRFKL